MCLLTISDCFSFKNFFIHVSKVFQLVSFTDFPLTVCGLYIIPFVSTRKKWIVLVRWLRSLNKLIYISLLEQCLAHNKVSLIISVNNGNFIYFIILEIKFQCSHKYWLWWLYSYDGVRCMFLCKYLQWK